MTDSIPSSRRRLPACAPRCRGVAILPLCPAVVPWGILAGSMALQNGLTPAQGLGMSAIVFAGAAQLVAMGMIKGGAGLLAILLSIFSSPPSIFSMRCGCGSALRRCRYAGG